MSEQAPRGATNTGTPEHVLTNPTDLIVAARLEACGVQIIGYAEQHGPDAPLPAHTVWIAEADSHRIGFGDLDNRPFIFGVFATLPAAYPELAFQLASASQDGGLYNPTLTEHGLAH